MNQPTREEYEDLKERVRRLEEQQTEPIHVTVERKYPDRELLQAALRKQDEQFEYLKGELKSLASRQNEYDKGLISHSRSTSVLQNEMTEARADILKIRESQLDQRDQIKEIRDQIKEIKDTMATKEDISVLKKNQDEQHDTLRLILRILGQKD
jgi:chromosome segregation ATPase